MKKKKIKELSQGMKVKINLALALSHKANLLILDEPTSGLDPVSRDEILGIFLDLVEKEGVSILFSTQIVSDLERSANYITYIRDGVIIDSATLDDFVNKYILVKGDSKLFDKTNKEFTIGYRENNNKFEFLSKVENKNKFKDFSIITPSIEDVMIFLERGSK